MGIDDRPPSITHLREFTRARSKGRVTHVSRDRAQVEAPADNKFFAFTYERFITAAIEYINNGSRGGALHRAVLETNERMRPSYDAAAKGITLLLSKAPVATASRRQRNVVAHDNDLYDLVSLRLHLDLQMRDGNRVLALLHFSAPPLSDPELALLETAVALATRQVDPGAIPAIAMVRSGGLLLIDNSATTADRVGFLRQESLAYRNEWRVAA
ncbi:hypothetical protein ACIGEP_16615 [Microbacterium sp. NPDC077663]|uniref:hypothetical protein n=1 Tax=Microbacterium sp. NPDC077663 TaxID=3364189 RepID=UPI0037C58488